MMRYQEVLLYYIRSREAFSSSEEGPNTHRDTGFFFRPRGAGSGGAERTCMCHAYVTNYSLWLILVLLPQTHFNSSSMLVALLDLSGCNLAYIPLRVECSLVVPQTHLWVSA